MAKTISNVQSLYLKNVINNKKKVCFEEKIAENRNNPKNIWHNLGMAPKGGMQSKISLKENGVVCSNSKNNPNTFRTFFST